MTLNYERKNSLENTREFLYMLLDPKQTKVPKSIREHARRCLRHFPANYEIEALSNAAPKILGTKFEDNFE